jgi:hypothetical protein
VRRPASAAFFDLVLEKKKFLTNFESVVSHIAMSSARMKALKRERQV